MAPIRVEMACPAWLAAQTVKLVTWTRQLVPPARLAISRLHRLTPLALLAGPTALNVTRGLAPGAIVASG